MAETKNKFSLEDIDEHDLNKIMLNAISELGQGLFIIEGQKIVYANEACATISGYSPEELLELNSFVDIAAPGQVSVLLDRLQKRILGRPLSDHYETELVHKDGRTVTIEVAVKVLRKLLPLRVLVIARDVTEQKKNEALIKHQALHDPLTDLPNRKAVDERFIAARNLATRSSTMVGVMYLDLDRFKNINDTLGHHVGDVILKEVAARFSSVVRDADTVARLGGDEFLVLLGNMHSVQHATKVASKLLQELERPIVVDDQNLHVSTSIGIALYPQNGGDMYTLLKHADIALYRAKEAGRNRFQYYDYAMNLESHAKLSLENDLREAVTKRQFILHYQPIIDDKRKLVGIEALVRWIHPTLGLLSPHQFIPMAEETGFIVAIGKWIMATAIKQHKQWLEQKLVNCRMALNFSSREFAEFDLVEKVEQSLVQNALPPKYLELEITESVAMNNSNRTARKFDELRQLGISLSIDDFGTGYSSLSYLKNFPVSRLKIDKSFVRHCTENEQDTNLIRAMIAMAHNLGIKIVAEGVETEEQYQLLSQEQCDAFQGYGIARPAPAEEFAGWLHAQKAT
jgi:diguanylate cyclase (GGDEF)-like protein/PAS domain S-box-containing protein